LSAAIAAADPMVAAYQGVLQIEGFYKGKIDGRLGARRKRHRAIIRRCITLM
jgi:hypothetical protein